MRQSPPRTTRSIADSPLVNEWCDSRDPSTVGQASTYKALWKCTNGHTYRMIVDSRVRLGVGCQKCKSIPYIRPELVRYWNSTDDIELFKPGSNKIVPWKCSCGYEWSQKIKNFSKNPVCPSCSGAVLVPGRNDALTASNRDVPESVKDKLLSVSYGSAERIELSCDVHGLYTTEVRFFVQGASCPKCAKRRSKGEKEIFDFVGQGTSNDRSLGIELDILIPDKKIAIEYNGLYWHSDRFVPKDYHFKKWQVCHDAGVQLIQIWEDDWKARPDVVKRMLSAKINRRQSIGARKVQVRDISFAASSAFLNYWHIQGAAKGSRYIGLFTDELVGVAVFRTINGTTYLERYASSVGISGGLDRTISFASPARLVTFADLAVSNGGLYRGWKTDGFISPDYKYLFKGKRVHKFNFRRSRFESDPELLFDPGLTEKQLAELNGIPRIYDAGKIRYLYN